jgi:hypothetical protein
VTLPPARTTQAAGPRLERLSLGEVALVTSEAPRWGSQIVHRTARSTTLRFLPLPAAASPGQGLRLLNAAGRQGLAATTRKLLLESGWRQIAVGDAPGVRQASLILYPAARRATAERLAFQLGFPMRRRGAGDDVVVFLGRDAAVALPSGAGVPAIIDWMLSPANAQLAGGSPS